MFIDWASQLNLLEHNPETHILKLFSLNVQKVLVQQVVSFLLEGTNSTRVLTSASHVRWAMEICGQGFALPIEEEDTILKVINLYKIWALQVQHRPKSFNENPQFFIQRLLEQSSLLFEARQSSKDLSERHAILCSKVLDMYCNLGRTLGNDLSEETWEIFLKVIIATSDSILRSDAPNSVENLQKRLCSQLQKVLFELWLLSGTKNPLLWGALQQRIRGWTRHMPLTLAWKVTSFALTKRMVNILYGVTGSDSVVIKFDDSVQHLDLDDKYVFYAWHRILNLIGNPSETIAQPPVLLAFMSGVELVVNQILKLSFAVDKTSALMAPTGNTILHIFGSWLFDCILLNRPGFEEGTALAMKILSNIMISNHKTDFLPVYISSYFSCLQRALSSEGRVLVAAITSNTNIFIKDIKGIRCLVPIFFTAIQKVLSGRIKSVENVMPPEHLRKSCLQIFGTIICLPNHLKTTEFATKNISGLAVPDYLSLKSHYSNLLTESLTKETNLSNTELLLNLSYTWVVEDIDNNCDFARQIIGLIIRKITQNRWGPEVMIPAFNTLCLLSQLYPKIEKGYEQANLVVDQLCRIIITIGNPPNTPKMEAISVLAFKCISYWVMVDQWIFNFKETRHSLLSAIVNALTGKQSVTEIEPINVPTPSSSKKKDKKKKNEDKNSTPAKNEIKKNQPESSRKIKAAAHNTLMTILNHLGNFPTRSGASVISSLALEEEILEENITRSNGSVTKETAKEFMRYYITDDRLIICVIDRPYHINGPCTCLIVRDKTGRYAWDSTLTYSTISTPNDPPIYHEQDISITTVPYQPTSIKPMDVNELSCVLGYLNECDTKNAYKSVEQQVQKEYKVLKRNNFRLNIDISTKIPPPADTYLPECKFQQSRMFLSHVGYLSLENRSKLFPLNMNSNFFQALRQLDEQPERVCINVGIIYGRKDQTEDEWFSNEGGSLDYQEFISTLGWGINLDEHRGHKGILDSQQSAIAPYWSNYDKEILFQVTTLTKNKHDDNELSLKRRQALHASTLIIWLEDFGNFQAQQIWKHVRNNLVIIVIVPQDFGLYHVRIFSKTDLYCLGPITDGCVLSKEVLGKLVRNTCISAWDKENTETPTPVQIRAECINRIYDSFKKTQTLEQFYTSQFTTLEADQISTLQLKRSKKRPKSVKQKSIKRAKFAPGIERAQTETKKLSRSTGGDSTTVRKPPPRKRAVPPKPAPRSEDSKSKPSPQQNSPNKSDTQNTGNVRGRGRGRGRGMGMGNQPSRPPPERPQIRGKPSTGFKPSTRPPPPTTKSGSWLGSKNIQQKPRNTKLFGTQRRQNNTDNQDQEY